MVMMEKVLMSPELGMQANRFQVVLIILCFIIGAGYWYKDTREMTKIIRCKGSSTYHLTYLKSCMLFFLGQMCVKENRMIHFMALCVWGSLLVYVILFIKTIDQQGVVHFMTEKLYYFFGLIEKVRDWSEINQHKTRYWWLIIIVTVIVFGILGAVLGASFNLVTVVSFMIALAIIAVSIVEARQSCRKILKTGLGTFACFALATGATASDYFGYSNIAIGYMICVTFYVFCWIMAILIAEDEPAKMSLSILNTGTSIITVIVNVVDIELPNILAAQEIPTSLHPILIAGSNLLSNLTLLPFLASGFLALLFKEMQIYWRNNRRNENV